MSMTERSYSEEPDPDEVGLLWSLLGSLSSAQTVVMAREEAVLDVLATIEKRDVSILQLLRLVSWREKLIIKVLKAGRCKDLPASEIYQLILKVKMDTRTNL